MAKTKHFVYSTLTAGQIYTGYSKGGADLPVPITEVEILGGTNLADRRMITPRGVVTEITDEQLTFLRENEVFKKHEENGFIVVSDSKVDPEVVAADMQGRSPDAPLVPEDLAVDPDAPQPAASSLQPPKAPPSNPRRA